VDVAPAPKLTKIGFRRDVKLFLGCLIGFLVVVILALTILMNSFVRQSESVFAQNASALAGAAVNHLCDERSLRGADLRELLDLLRIRFNIAGITLATASGTPLVSGVERHAAHTEEIARTSCLGAIYFVFDAADLDQIRRQSANATIICLAATIAGTLLLLLYLPRIVRPVEQLLDQADALGGRKPGEDETEYLVGTFRRSIVRLEQQEAELRRLHDQEKSRADTLEQITATLTRSLTSGFIATNADGLIVSVNRAAVDMLGIEDRHPDESRPIAVDALLGSTPFADALRDAVAARTSVSRVEATHASGARDRIIGLTTVPLVNERGEHFGMLALFTDLTAIRELETRVREMQIFADLGEISAGIAHEFRNSLSTILGYLRLARHAELSPAASERLTHAEAELNELAQAVEALLHFARPMRLDRRPLDVQELASSIVARLAPGAAKVEYAVEGDEAEVDGDRALLARALENVIRNAADAVQETGHEGRVRIRTSRARSMVRIEVEDDGVGIAARDVPRLFLPFQSEKSSGFGLGLPLAKKIVLLHGGTIRLAPREGGGAVVTIELPPSGTRIDDAGTADVIQKVTIPGTTVNA
jgi:signal transduction histidine kinase